MRFTVFIGGILFFFSSIAAVPTHQAVIELFTSQSCSSCPAADRLVGGYADSPDILPLSFHVTYWNYTGWEDPYSKEGFTKRQLQYKEHLGRLNIYTPQAVVQGKYDIVGSEEASLQEAVSIATHSNPWIDITLQIKGDEVIITVPASPLIDARLFLIGYQKQTRNFVPRGENADTYLSHRNSVVELLELAHYRGKELSITHKKPAGDGTAILLQTIENGQILGIAWL